MIRLDKVTRRFDLGGQRVYGLHRVDLAIGSGEYLAVTGPSGSGKSTLLNVLGLLDTPDEGEYWLDQVNTGSLNETDRARLRAEQIGFVFQDFHLIPRLSAAENIELPMVLNGIAPNQRRQRVDQLVRQFGLEQRQDHLPSQLSGGQRQRVAIARAVSIQPSVLLADEPTGNLDSRSGDEAIQVLESLNQQGLTLIVVTHDPHVANRAGRQIRLQDGLILEGDPVQLAAAEPHHAHE